MGEPFNPEPERSDWFRVDFSGEKYYSSININSEMGIFYSKISKFLLLAGDLTILMASLWLTLLIRHGNDFSQAVWSDHWATFFVLYLLWLPIFYSLGLYDIKSNIHLISLLTNLTKSMIFSVLAAIIYFYLTATITPKTILALNLVIAFILIFIWRRLIMAFSQSSALEKNILIIGWDPLLEAMLKKEIPFGYKIKGILSASQIADQDSGAVLIYQNLEEIEKIVSDQKIQLIVIAQEADQNLINELFNLIKLKINFISLANFYEQAFQKIPLSIINRGWFLENFSEGNKKTFDFFKRFFDILLSIIFGVISLPFIPILILGVKLSSPGPVFFKQIRIGKNSRPFKAVKFRSMYFDPSQEAAWTSANDPRITGFGKFLRKTRVDEIPQLWNILIGEMSFVGPRPERPEFIAELEKNIPFYKERLLVKPGLTGWDQISGQYHSASSEDSLAKLQYDLYYVKNRNLVLDLGIILKTINTILKGTGR